MSNALEPAANADLPPHQNGVTTNDFFSRVIRQLWTPAGLFVLLIIYVLFTRIWALAAKVMHHDESLFAYYGFWLYKGRGYDYQPILHGPVLQFVSAFFFLLFGDDQWTMRMPNMIGGLLMFPVAWHWRRYLGGGAAAILGVTALIALSPSISFYARFLRNDVPYLAVTMWCALCIMRMLHTGRPLFVWATVLTAALMFSMMESSIFFFAACLGYLVTMALADLLIWRKPADERHWPAWLRADMLTADGRKKRRLKQDTIGIISALAAAPLTLLLGWLYYRVFFDTLPIWAPLQLVASKVGLQLPQMVALGIWAFAGYIGFFLTLLLLMFSYQSPRGRYGLMGWLAHLLWRNRWHFVAALAVAVIAYTTIFTTFFTFTKTASFDHTARDFVGPERALTPVQIYKNTWDYWWDQHKLHRIKGPFHYYLPILFLYELPILVLAGLGWCRAVLNTRRRWLMIGLLVVAHIILANIIALSHPIDWELMDKKFHVTSAAHLHLALIYAELLVIIAPLLFRQGRRPESFLTYWGVTSLFAYSYAGEKVPWLTVHSVGPFALLAAAELVRLWRRFKSPATSPSNRRPIGRTAFIAIAIAAVVYQVRNNHLLLFVQPWSPAERLVYNHTSPDIVTAVSLIEEVGEKTNFGIQVPVFMQGEMGWPLHWYLREYTNIIPTVGETADTTTRPIVMVDWHLAGNPNLQENYTLRRMKVREWWEPPMLDLSAMADIYMVFTNEENRDGGLAASRYHAMRGEWRKLWHYLAYREIWIDPQNRNWSNGANEFCFAIRNDIAEKLMTYPWLAATPKRTDITVFVPY